VSPNDNFLTLHQAIHCANGRCVRALMLQPHGEKMDGSEAQYPHRGSAREIPVEMSVSHGLCLLQLYVLLCLIAFADKDQGSQGVRIFDSTMQEYGIYHPLLCIFEEKRSENATRKQMTSK
jgi:hypothetical protein